MKPASAVDRPISTCPACGRASTTLAAPRPDGLPFWFCAGCGHREVGPPSDDAFAETVARLGAKDKSLREAEIETLVRIGDEAVPVLTRVLRGKANRVAQPSAVIALGRIGTAAATEELILWAAEQERRARFWRRMMLPLSVVVVVAVGFAEDAVGIGSNSIWADFIRYSAILGVFFTVGSLGLASLRRQVVSAFASLGDARAVGPLVLAYQDVQLRKQVTPVLVELLPEATEEQFADFSQDQLNAIRKLLRCDWHPLRIAAIHAVASFGGQEVLTPLNELLESYVQTFRAAAIEALPRVQARVALQKESATLLRAGTAPDEAPETLLRPATALPDPDEAQLLRRSEGSDA